VFALKQILFSIIKLLALWIVIFDVQRIVFSIHNWSKFEGISIPEWLGAFIFSFRLDLATAALLSVIPLLFLVAYILYPQKWFRYFFYGSLFIEILLCVCVHAGEINAYPEWNHKLTTRVFNHLLNPDEVVRTADGSMTVWFILYTLLEFFIAYKATRWIMDSSLKSQNNSALKWYWHYPLGAGAYGVSLLLFLLLGRGGFQQIPINIDSAYYSKNYVTNDLSVNSFYFFAKSFMLYSRSEIGALFKKIPEKESKATLADFYNYELNHNRYFLKSRRPNVVFVVLESWTANAIGSLSGEKGATPYFDSLTKQGLLFTNIYASAGTSEIGNSTIFSGYPALPEISISMQPDKHRKIPCLNQDLKKWGYSSHYLFSGDLKYGNIGSYFTDHGFDELADEKDFPAGMPKGKLNYYDEDLYKLFLQKINRTKAPFLHCAFTGSTHSPYDFPQKGTPKWTGSESDFMSSMYYADKCLNDFIENCKKESWYKNTIFIFVADHGHASELVKNPNLGAYFHIPLLIFGEPLKEEYRGQHIPTIGSQGDIVRTLLYQMGGDYKRYQWSKDLMNPDCPQFALHTINRGYGWISDKGNFSYNIDANYIHDNTLSKDQFKWEEKRCQSFMSLVYEEYKDL
jgi:phosphoglycerol transferase MdoB-like AlkP superfamily enzyme